VLAESSTGEPLAGFPRYVSNIVPPPGGTFLVLPREGGKECPPIAGKECPPAAGEE